MPVDPEPPKPPEKPTTVKTLITYPFKYIGYVFDLLKWNKGNA